MNIEIEKKKANLHYTMSFIGGFLGMAPVMGVAKAFASALTANWISTISAFLSGNYLASLARIGAAIVFLIPVAGTTVLKKKKTADYLKKMAILIDVIDAIVLVLIPEGTYFIVAMYPNMFAMACQWCCFSGAYDYSAANIFMTNNTRQWISALTEVYINKEDKFRIKAEFYGKTLGSFLVGVALCWICFQWIGKCSPLLAIMALVFAWIQLEQIEKEKNG